MATKGIVHKPLADVDPNVQSFGTPEPVKSFECTPSKMKTKTRGKPTARDIGTPASAVDAPRPSQEKVKTCKRAFRVFQALLPSPNDVVQQRCELSWDEMIWSFNSVGLVPLKLYGSVWIFRPLPKIEQGPDKVKVNQSLQFHEVCCYVQEIQCLIRVLTIPSSFADSPRRFARAPRLPETWSGHLAGDSSTDTGGKRP